MYYDKTYHISDYLNVQDMNDLVDKVKDLVIEMSTGKNLFNINTIIRGYELMGSDGSIRANASWWTSDWILVEGNKNYVSKNVSSKNFYFYDSNKNYISRTTTGLSPNNARFLRVNGTISTLESNPQAQVELGNTSTSYEPYIQILPPSNYDLDLPIYELNDFIFVEDIDKIERNIMNIGYDFFQPPGYIQNKIWRDWYETDVYKSFGADDLNRMITDMNILYSHKDERPTIYNLFTNENWDGETTLEWE